MLTAAVLVVGMIFALYVIRTGVKPVAAIVAAQAVTVIAAPLMAVTLLWLTNLPSVMGEYRNGRVHEPSRGRRARAPDPHGLVYCFAKGLACDPRSNIANARDSWIDTYNARCESRLNQRNYLSCKQIFVYSS